MAGRGKFQVIEQERALESEDGMGLLWYTNSMYGDFSLKIDWRVKRRSVPNRKKQKEAVNDLKILHDNYNSDRNRLFAGAAISGLFAIFYDGIDYFRVKNIPDNNESRLMLWDLGLELYNSVNSIKSTARSSLATLGLTSFKVSRPMNLYDVRE
jgi:hypothetical protein